MMSFSVVMWIFSGLIWSFGFVASGSVVSMLISMISFWVAYGVYLLELDGENQ